jgi:hypothetical protein
MNLRITRDTASTGRSPMLSTGVTYDSRAFSTVRSGSLSPMAAIPCVSAGTSNSPAPAGAFDRQ